MTPPPPPPVKYLKSIRGYFTDKTLRTTGLVDIIRIASNDWTYELPSRATITSHVQKLHKTEKAKGRNILAVPKLSRDNVTSRGAP